MGILIDVIVEAVERTLAKGGWNGVPLDGGRIEGSLRELEVESVEGDGCDLDGDSIDVVVTGLGSIFHVSADGEEVNDEHQVLVVVTISATSHAANDGVCIRLDAIIRDVSLDQASDA